MAGSAGSSKWHCDGEVHAKTLRRYAFPTMRKVFPRGNGIFQEDNASPHTSKLPQLLGRRVACNSFHGPPKAQTSTRLKTCDRTSRGQYTTGHKNQKT